MNGSKELTAARVNKKDEFYTPIELIEEELRYYKDCFRGKTVYCNCDDPERSMFFKYFFDNFTELGLGRLISTCYRADGFGTMFDSKLSMEKFYSLAGNGSYDSEECGFFLDEADVIVTNPPFSLFRPFLKLMLEKEKDVLILGHITGIQCIPLFKYFMEHKLRFGVSIHSGDRKFFVPDDYELEASGCGFDEQGRRYINVKGVRWFTTLPNDTQDKQLTLIHSYYNEPGLYRKYDLQDAINISKTEEIPFDYEGIMGVPITFLDKYCREQFELLGTSHNKEIRQELFGISDEISVDGKEPYERIFIRNRNPRPSSEFVPITKPVKKRAAKVKTTQTETEAEPDAPQSKNELVKNGFEVFREHVNGKILYCACGDPDTSEICQYLLNNFEELGLDKLIVVGYNPFGKGECVTKADGETHRDTLLGNGDFRSRECSLLMDDGDVIVADPPHGMIRECIAQLMEERRTFIVMGDDSSSGYKEIQNLIRLKRITVVGCEKGFCWYTNLKINTDNTL